MINKLISEVMAVPLGELIASIGEGVGKAQAALDASSLKQTLEMYAAIDNKAALTKLFKEIGYRPTFYALPETEVTTTVSISIAGDVTEPTNSPTKQDIVRTLALKKVRSYVAPINATNASKYNVDIKAATTLTFKIVPVPAPLYVENLLENDEVDKFLEGTKIKLNEV